MEELRDRIPEYLLIAFVLVAGVAAGLAGVRSAKLGALAVTTLVVLLIVSRRPVFLAVVAVVGCYAVQRLGSATSAPGTAGGISYSDAFVAAASVMALPALSSTTELRRLRTAAGGLALYLALLLPSVIANPSSRVYLEWAHRLVDVGGALLVGAWLVRERADRTAVRLLTAVSCTVAAIAVSDSFSSGFQSAKPLGMNKNFAGALFAAVLIVLLAAAESIHVIAPLRFAAIVLVGGGLAASQSRGAALGAVLGVLVAFAMNPKAHDPRLKIFAGLVTAVLGVGAYISIHHQLSLDQNDLNNSSVGVRFNVERVTRDIWRTSPVVGVGMKYFLTGKYGPYAQPPNNVVDNELAESGLIGLAGFILLQLSVAAAGIRRRGSPLVAAAVGAVAGQLLHGMVDIYWSAGVVTLPFLLLGMGLAGATATDLPGLRRRRLVGDHRVG